ncbi:hypothetical protein K458DRAFT_300405, partial [Lentithecium fluviatile CBS 122367]
AMSTAFANGRFFSLNPQIAQIEFNKSIAGCYRDGNKEYDAVGVLLLTWRDDDMKCKEKEVDALEKVFRDEFGYQTEQYQIPPTDSSRSLFTRLNAFLRCYDSPSKLGIIYYGNESPIVDGNDLHLFARRTPHGVPTADLSRTNTTLSDLSIPESPTEVKSVFDNPVRKDARPQQPHIGFMEICEQIKISETDMLLIVDSCFAAGAFTDLPFGGRKCELFCSIAEKDWARAPGQEGSFTKILTNSLVEMVRESPLGFSTPDLYRRIYRQQHAAHKPYHFNQSRRDYGKIWLRPCQQQDDSSTKLESNDDSVDSKYSIDVRFHLTKSLDMVELNKVVKALQWIPFVQRVKMQSMHSPVDELNEFIRALHMANRLRPLLARIRRRREVRLAQQLYASSSPSSPIENTTGEQFLGKKPRNVDLFDWSGAKAVTPGDERMSPGEYFDLKIPPPKLYDLHVPATKADEVPHSFSREAQTDAPVEPRGNTLQGTAKPRPSQRILDGLLFFTLGVLAPTVVGWVTQGCAAPSAAA